MQSTTDAAFARRRLERAIAHTTKPTLDAEAVDDLMTIAQSLDSDGVTVIYTAAGLNRAASIGWQDKAGLTSDQYDLGGGAGKTLDRSQWFAHCMQMAASYASGAMGVMGVPARSGTRSTRVISSTAAASEVLP